MRKNGRFLSTSRISHHKMLRHAELHLEALVERQQLPFVQLLEHYLLSHHSMSKRNALRGILGSTLREVGESLRRALSVLFAHSLPSRSRAMTISSTEFCVEEDVIPCMHFKGKSRIGTSYLIEAAANSTTMLKDITRSV